MPYLSGYAASSSGAGLFRALLGISAQNCTRPCGQIHKLLMFNEEFCFLISFISSEKISRFLSSGTHASLFAYLCGVNPTFTIKVRRILARMRTCC